MTDTKTPAEPQQAQDDNGLSHRQIMTILYGLMAGMFLAALDQTIVSTAIRTISDDLHGLSQQAWATTAYLITSTVATPLYGKLSDLYGRRPFYLAAITIFVLGSALCTFSTSMYELAGFRALQGLGAGGLMSLAFAIIGDIVAPRERARYQGYFLAVFGTSSVLGPLVGGFFAGQDTILGIAGWRWVFLVNVPVGVVALIVVAKVLHIPHTRRPHRVDWWGAALLTLGVVPLLIVAEQGREWGWGSNTAATCYVIGIVGVVSWVLVERRMGDDALIPMRLFGDRIFSLASLIGVIFGMAMFGGFMLIPQYFQIVKGSSPTEAGLLMIPVMAGMMGSSIVSGQLTSKTGRYKIFPILGTGIAAVAMGLFSLFVDADTPIVTTSLFMVLLGIGLGQCMQTLILVVQNAVPPRDMGVATSAATFFRQMGATAGTAVFLSVLFSNVSEEIAKAFTRDVGTPSFQAALNDPGVLADPANGPVIEMVRNPNPGGAQGSGVLSDSSFISNLDPRLAAPFKEGFSEAMQLVFLIASCVMFVAFVLVFFIKEVPLRTMSGLQAKAAAEAEDQATATTPAGSSTKPTPAPTPGAAPATSAPPASPQSPTPPATGSAEQQARRAAGRRWPEN
ncbi:MDR family MFS transporter [Streptomyces sp. SID3343]|uniref:MDR family MFS transporter n=1 Tax=Streptomyces sp. SID3343 TaxID=2690260 RepID=UPI00136E6435|nr:MDR family MFS transporter [Streptomyces sp. SID3343]MYW04328.1 DHA2 family efflux MFS transporter permease subunit [Streptomyces sp. SID3343]